MYWLLCKLYRGKPCLSAVFGNKRIKIINRTHFRSVSVPVRYDLHRSHFTCQFLCTLHCALFAIHRQRKQSESFKVLSSIDLIATDINLQVYPNHRTTGGGSFTLGFNDSRGTPTVKSQSFLEICYKEPSNLAGGDVGATVKDLQWRIWLHLHTGRFCKVTE